MSELETCWYLLRIFGRRVFLSYGIVSLLSVSTLAALYVSSRYGLEGYVADQLRRIPWDISVIQRGETYRFAELRAEYLARPEVLGVEAIGFLRMRNMAPVRVEVEGQPLPVRWVAFLAVTTPTLLPADLRKLSPFPTDGMANDLPGVRSVGAALVGVHDEVFKDRLANMQKGSAVRLSVDDEEHDQEEGHGRQARRGHSQVLLEGQLEETPIQVERQEFNKWMLREIGSLAYLPEESIVFQVSLESFQKLAYQFHMLFLTSEGIHGGDAAPVYVPEITHLISVDRQALVSTWDLEGSLAHLAPQIRDMYRQAQWLTPFSYITSDLYLLLSRMSSIARLVGLATLLIAIPLLWLVWALARDLSRLLFLNERRLIGLAVIRGIPIQQLGRSLLYALSLGGALGGVLGLVVGTGLPIVGYLYFGRSAIPWEVLVRALAYFGGFALLGVVLAILSGLSILRQVRKLTPRQAVARVEGQTADTLGPRLSWYYIAGFFLALGLGTYKIVSWISGFSPVLESFGSLLSRETRMTVALVEGLLNFVAVPLFLYGLAGLVGWRVGWIQRALSVLSIPLVGALRWFVSQYMALQRHRIATLLFVAAVAAALSLLPQVGADVFHDRVLRGVKASLGADLLFDFDMARFSGQGTGFEAVKERRQRLRPHLTSIRSLIEQDQRVASMQVIEQFLIPGVYIPGQSGLLLNIIEDPASYLNTVYFEDQLGVTRAFSSMIGSLSNGGVLASQGLLRLRRIPLGQPFPLGYSQEGTPIPVRLEDMTAFLPGQPSRGIQQREGFLAAEIDYLNHLLGSDARIITAEPHLVKNPEFGELQVLPSRIAIVVRASDGIPSDDLQRSILAKLPIQPEEARSESLEKQRISKDMFISLALENMKVYMFGGLVLALASVAAIASANFLADRRTFALLRLRGVALPLLLRVFLSIFVIPMAGGVILGVALGGVAGYGISQAIWDLPRVHGVAGFLSSRFWFSAASWIIAGTLALLFTLIAIGFALWLFRKTAREAIREG